MESLEDLKAIIDNAPEGASHYDGIYYRYSGDEVQSAPSKRFAWEFVSDGSVQLELTRSLSDIERIIQLEERLNNSEYKKEECKHLSSTASYTHVTCDSCYMIRTDGGWGCASRKWFDNIESAKFYEKNGFLPR